MNVAGSGASTELAATWLLRGFVEVGVAVCEGALILVVVRAAAVVAVILVIANASDDS
jgi:hypothetical protein